MNQPENPITSPGCVRQHGAHRLERGQSFLELALSMVFLLVLLAAVIDLGWAFYTLIALRDATQEAASYGSICPVNETKIRDRLRMSASTPLNMNDIDPANISVQFIDPITGLSGMTPTVGNSIRVTATVQHRIMTPLIGGFIGNNWNYPLTVSVADTILRDDCAR